MTDRRHCPLPRRLLPFALALAATAWRAALRDDDHLRQGLNVCAGQLTNQHVAAALNLPYTPIDALL